MSDFILFIPSFQYNRFFVGKNEQEKGIDKNSGQTVVRVNPEFYRPAEVETLLGDSSLIEKELGWKANTGLEELVELMYRADYDRVAQNRVYF